MIRGTGSGRQNRFFPNFHLKLRIDMNAARIKYGIYIACPFYSVCRVWV